MNPNTMDTTMLTANVNKVDCLKVSILYFLL